MHQALFSLIETMLPVHERLVLAIDGGAASGKTTLAALLAQTYDGAVIHMDDFFLQPHQRTPERLSEAGGNVDRERFSIEVLPHLHEKKAFSYTRFDCARMALGEKVIVPNKRLLIVEGSYSHHPALAHAYDLKLFLETDLETRISRILRRNGKEKCNIFLSRWIPLENAYFEAFSVKEKADLTIRG